MGKAMRRLNHIVAAGVLASLALPLSASDAQIANEREAELGAMLQELADPDLERWQRLERRIVRAWSQSGSASADLLLQRGREALRTGDTRAAIEHLTALVDHAPDFAEGYNTRATAFFMANQYGPAMADIQQTLALNPDHFGALSGMGIILEELEMSDAALEAYRAANAIHPHRPDILRALERLELSLEGRPL
ncbi:hypothetical protein HUK65_08510 [Rhodobacteraceae bacterium 2376]|uniref:Tetratricopeptide repeat protein n=2 Tax=Rhabdonatronobacter sediminivivens TaxID=2743469 RepID=A0A7Z0I013_9RHOB|nr:hypothetical protein [Rhabdonatronobacter sediminivivens]